MNLREFKEEMQKINNLANARRLEIAHKFFDDNAAYKIGDIVDDVWGGKLQITGYDYNMFLSYYSNMLIDVSYLPYHAVELKKDGTPKEHGQTTFFQSL
jgi:hypothetical protein